MTPELSYAVNFPACLTVDFPRELPVAEAAVAQVLAAINAGDSFKPLEDCSPGLRGNDWSVYLRCSEARMVHAASLLHRKGITRGRLLDYGAYFGNFALMLKGLGFEVDAVDSYEAYAPSLAPIVSLFNAAGVGVLDFAHVGRDLTGLGPSSYDVVLCMGVIEHVPHTPRVLLEPLNRVLKAGGVLIIDTPNLAQLFNRQRLARGESVMPPVSIQYHADVPFEGHHREYTVDEVVWMAEALGHDVIGVELFNYSVYGQQTLQGRDLTNHWRMAANPTMRELVMVASRKREARATKPATADWQAVYEDPESYWRDRLPAIVAPEDDAGILAAETLVVDLQAGVNERDRMLQDLQSRHHQQHGDVVALMGDVVALMDRLGALQYAFDMTPVERLKRAARRYFGDRS